MKNEFHILGIIIPTDFHIFQRGCNHQPDESRQLFSGNWTSKKALTRKATIGSCNDVKSRELDDAVDFIENPSIEIEKWFIPILVVGFYSPPFFGITGWKSAILARNHGFLWIFHMWLYLTSRVIPLSWSPRKRWWTFPPEVCDKWTYPISGIMVNKGNHPQMALIQVSEIL